MELIDRQAAIDFKVSHGINESGVLYVPYGEVKKYLEQLPSAQPEVLACGSGDLVQESDSLVQDLVQDCISRQAAITAIGEDGTWLERQGCTEITMCERKQRDADILSELPTIDAVPVVRCRNCIWTSSLQMSTDEPPVYGCPVFGREQDENGYCAWGKERG